MLGHTDRGDRRLSKVCTTCGVEKALTEYYAETRALDGRESRCKACKRAAVKAWATANADRVKDRNRRYYEAHRAEAIARAGEWSRANPQRRREIRAKHQAKAGVIERRTVGARKRRADDLARFRAAGRDAAHRRRVREEASGCVTGAQWEAIKAFYGHRCLRCDRAEPEIVLTMDHVIPIVGGGAHHVHNIQPLCKPCNSRKNRAHRDYRRVLYAISPA